MEIKEIKTVPFMDQKMGTSGLRKKAKVFQQENYLQNYIQSVFDTLGAETFKGKTMVIGGDGRFFNKEAVQIIIKMAAANGWGKIMVGHNGLLSTPATSLVIRKYKAEGGFILSASHNPAGPDEDFGIKYNMSNGSSTPEKITLQMFEKSKELSSYKIAEMEDVDLSRVRSFNAGGIEIEVIDTVKDYAKMMQELFDFDAIRELFKSGFKMKFDAMHAVTGPYGKVIFEDMLGADPGTVINGIPLSDFGGGHPDPGPKYSKELFDFMMGSDAVDFAAGSDGDGDRNLILGKGIFVTPNDSIAVMVDNYKLIPGYKEGLLGVVRSLPTSFAVDAVAKKMGIKCYETPTGWRFFGSLMDGGLVTLCAEESFGTGSNHIREKDGVWAILFWLNILAVKRKSVAEIMDEHWQEYGRNYYMRYDYEGIDTDTANEVMDNMRRKVIEINGSELKGRKVELADDFRYVDPVDGYVSEHQGIRVMFADQSRFIMRLSGTGSTGATLRLYMEKYEQDKSKLHLDTKEVLDDVAKTAVRFAELEKKIGRTEPDIIT